MKYDSLNRIDTQETVFYQELFEAGKRLVDEVLSRQIKERNMEKTSEVK